MGFDTGTLIRAAGSGLIGHKQGQLAAQDRQRQQAREDEDAQMRDLQRQVVLLDLHAKENPPVPTPRYSVDARGNITGSGFGTEKGARDFQGRTAPPAEEPGEINVNAGGITRKFPDTEEGRAAARQFRDTSTRAAGDVNREIASQNRVANPPDPSDLRHEFTSQPIVRDSQQIVQSYAKLRSVAQAPPSGPNDLAIIFSFMKMLDPGSVVREGEFANAENSQGVPERVKAMYNRALEGERLAPETRTEFLRAADLLITGQRESLSGVVDRFTLFAEQNGFNPEDVVFDPFGTPSPAREDDAGNGDDRDGPVDVEKRALELRAQGLSDDDVVNTLRSEGLVR